MSEVLVLSQEDIAKVLDMKLAIKAVEDVYIQKASGNAEVFPMVFHEFESGVADMDIKSGHLKNDNVYGLKLVSWYLHNEEKSLPQLYGTTLLFDDRTGEPIALLNANGITGMRTGAAGAIGAKYLGRDDSKVLTVVGVGEQAAYQIAACLIAMESITKVYLVNPHNPKSAFEKLEEIREAVDGLLENSDVKRQYSLGASEDIGYAIEKSDIIITVTPSMTPLVKSDWLKPGAHISCVGADISGKCEVEAEVHSKARIFVDDLEQSISVGECEIPIRDGYISREDILGEIGLVISGEVAGRLDEDEITLFDSTGIALQDLLVSKLVVDVAKEKGIGTIVII